MNPATATVLDFVADCYNPLLALVAILAPVVSKSRDRPWTRRYYVAASLGILLVYLLKALDDHFLLWSAIHLDYSTHFAFAVSLAVSLAIFCRRWLPALAASLVLYAGLIRLMGYHSVLDVLSAGALSALLTGATHRALGTFGAKRIV